MGLIEISRGVNDEEEVKWRGREEKSDWIKEEGIKQKGWRTKEENAWRS